jgi:hypothetical protein
MVLEKEREAGFVARVMTAREFRTKMEAQMVQKLKNPNQLCEVVPLSVCIIWAFVQF